MHIAALDPRFLRREEVTQEILDREREIYREQAKATGKPEPVIEKIVNGKMEKFYEENCLYEQHFIKDEGVTIKETGRSGHRQARREHRHPPLLRFKVGEMDGAAPAPPSPTRRLHRRLPLNVGAFPESMWSLEIAAGIRRDEAVTAAPILC